MFLTILSRKVIKATFNGDDVIDEITNYGIYTYSIMVYNNKHFISQLLIFGEKNGPNRPQNVPSPFKIFGSLRSLISVLFIKENMERPEIGKSYNVLH